MASRNGHASFKLKHPPRTVTVDLVILARFYFREFREEDKFRIQESRKNYYYSSTIY